jgi:carnitine O-palmitoyltransferase 2
MNSSSSSRSTSASSSLLVSCRFKSTGSKKNLSHDQPYLQLSGIPTYHFQKSLPRLPIPPLEQTLKKYLDSTGPLLSPSEFDITKSIVEEFSKNEGPNLHAQLLAKDTANNQTSFISEAWFDMYLRGRYPVPINSNPFLMMRDDPNPKANDQVT